MFSFTKIDSEGGARTGVINTPHGEIKTPAFTPVATKATVRTLTPQELLDAGSQAVLANTYHLYLSPGLDVINSFGGFAPFMKWSGPTITDSGGYQVSFLWNPKNNAESSDNKISDRAKSVKVTEEGAEFRSHIDGVKHLLTPEKSMEIQSSLNADIIMAFDQPLSFDSTLKRQNEAFYRTLRWEERSMKRWKEIQKERKNYQALYGIVQGETDKKLRKESMEFVLSLGFPGIAIGGASIGSNPSLTASALDTISEMIPGDLPVHALGLGGGPEGIFEAVSRSVDTFDNTSITRMARTGMVFLTLLEGGNRQNKFRIDVRKFKTDSKDPICKDCKCFTCNNFSRGYIRHLIVNQEILGGRLCSIHNIYYINELMSLIRKNISSGDYLYMRKDWLK